MKNFLLLSGMALFLVACSPVARTTDEASSAREQSTVTLVSPSGERLQIEAELAVTPEEHQSGLMWRTHLDPDAGMLFIFPAELQLSFWMKNTLIPLDLLYFDAQGSLISVHTMTPCTADPCPTYVSARAAQYALEVEAGYAERHGIGEGWRLER